MVEIRPVDRDKDHAALQELTRACPMQADISISIEREPDFFALADARGDTRTLVAVDGERIVGCASASRRPARTLGQDTILAVLADMKVAPDYRKQGIAQRLLLGLVDEQSELEAAVITGLTAAGNTAIEATVQHLGEHYELRALGDFSSYELLTQMPMRVSKQYLIRPAAEQDRQALIALLEEFYSSYSLAPRFDGGGLEEQLARSPGMDLSSYLLAIEGGRPVAALGEWNQHHFKQTRIMTLPLHLRMLSLTVRTGARFLPIGDFPAVGHQLKLNYLRHPAYTPGHEDALAALVRTCVNRARSNKEHFCVFACAVGDPLIQVLAGIPKTAYRYRLMAGAARPEAEAMVELTRSGKLFDDPSLA